MTKYKVVDNFLEEKHFIQLKDIMEGRIGKNINWFIHQGVSSDNTNDGYYFTHLFYEHNLGASHSYDTISELLKIVKPNVLIRIKGNLYPSTSKIIEHSKHTDFDFKHKGFIFYINTNDGFTKLKDGTKIKSVANRGLYFDSAVEHNSSTCTGNQPRINININYI